GVPAILGEGGTVSNFIGDAVMATFGAPVRQRDHALRAVRAALAFLDATDAVVAEHPEWPRFRVGVNSGPALVGNIGGEAVRAYTAIGDTVNLAARLEAASSPGRVVMGARTAELAGRSVERSQLGSLSVKGKAAPVAAFLVEGLALDDERRRHDWA
ncbi:MAG: adenylate/guanylate cyclase domain-containing protein, partial [Planctomycetes bacterium]|nr:adenylate/guanylate cyclase domain-containing protein [Planctomycetota bacterium]